MHRYKYRVYKIGYLPNLLKKIIFKYIDIKDDKISIFERKILGGVLYQLLHGGFSFREYWHNIFIMKFSKNNYFNIVKPIRGKASPHKIVVVCQSASIAKMMINYLTGKGIFTLNGYSPLTSNLDYLPNMKKINGCVVEMPIENDDEKMYYLFDSISNFINK